MRHTLTTPAKPWNKQGQYSAFGANLGTFEPLGTGSPDRFEGFPSLKGPRFQVSSFYNLIKQLVPNHNDVVSLPPIGGDAPCCTSLFALLRPRPP